MRSERPLLTIGIPTFNCGLFLPDTIASIHRQDFQQYEIVIVDNASTDETEEIVAALSDPRIRYFRNDSNIGSRKNHNRCLEEARGVYFKFVGADDVLLDGILSSQLSLLQQHPDLSLVSCDMFLTDQSLQKMGMVQFLPGKQRAETVTNTCLSGMSNYIGGPTNFMFRALDGLAVGFDSSYRFISDLKFALEILKRGDYANISRPGYLYRRHAGSDTEINCPVGLRNREFIRLIEEFDWWNPLNCAKMITSEDNEERRRAFQKWKKIVRPRSVLRSVTAISTILQLKSIAKAHNRRIFE